MCQLFQCAIEIVLEIKHWLKGCENQTPLPFKGQFNFCTILKNADI